MSIHQLLFAGAGEIPTDPYWEYVQILFQPGGNANDSTPIYPIDTLDSVAWTNFAAPVYTSGFSPYTTSYPYDPSYQAKSYLLGGVYRSNTPTNQAAASRTISTFNAQADFTLEGWVYMARDGEQYGSYNYGAQVAQVRLSSSPTSNNVTLNAYSCSQGVYLFANINNQSVSTPSTTSGQQSRFFPLMTWAHLAFVRDGANYKTFINGVLQSTVATSSITTPRNNYDTAVIGVASAGQTNANSYYVCDVRLVAGTAIYTANFTPPAQPLTAVSGTRFLLNGNGANLYNSGYQAKSIASVYQGGSNLAFGSYANGTSNVRVVSSPSLYNQGSLFVEGDGSGYRFYEFNTPAISDFAGQTYEGWFRFENSQVQFLSLYPSNVDVTGYNANWYLRRYGANIDLIAPTVGTLFSVDCGIQDSTWYHIALVRDTNKIFGLYVNGVGKASAGWTSVTFTQENSHALVLGVKTSTAAQIFYVDSFRYSSMVRYTDDFTPTKFPSIGTGSNGGATKYGQILYAGYNYGNPALYYSSSQVFQTLYDFVVPPNVTSISAVCIGCGGPNGGGGGGLAYGTISVTPGEVLKLKVGFTSFYYMINNTLTQVRSGDSEIYRSNGTTLLLRGQGGLSGAISYYGTYVTPSGGGYTLGTDGVTSSGGATGGTGGNSTESNGFYHSSGGGGAAGYTGNGGNGGCYSATCNPTAGSGGGGGGGSGGYQYTDNDPNCGDLYPWTDGDPGGGVAPFGQKVSGGANESGSLKNTGSNYKQYAPFFTYGGGGPGGRISAYYDEECNYIEDWYAGNIYAGQAVGAIRIIWGTGRSYPNTNTNDIPFVGPWSTVY